MDRTVKGALAAVRDARNTILIAHAVKTVFALALLGDFWLELVGIASGGDLLDVVRHFLQEGLRQVAPALGMMLAYLVAGPALTQYVLAALARRELPAVAALRRFWRALVIAVLRLGVFVVTAVFTFAFAIELPTRAPPELETAAQLVPLAIGGVLLLWLSTVHDVAAAQLAADETPRAWRALVRGVRASSPALIAIHLAFMISAALTYAAGEAASRMLWPSLGFMLSQTFALGAAFVSAAWLSVAMARTNQPFRTST